ncbi:MAG: SlyX family protein [Alphaproteobacteria bacterium]|nr:SlyX family protein [Alphaproteobacteria bacterium]
MSDTAARIAELEMRMTHQDKVISDLNEVVLAQWRRIESLERQLARINEEMQALESGPVPVDRPPHY